MSLTGPLARAFDRGEGWARRVLLWAGVGWAAFVLLVTGGLALALGALGAPAWTRAVLAAVLVLGVGAYLMLYAYARFQLAAMREAVETAVEVERAIRGRGEEPEE